MTETISKDKTILVLAFAATFIAGATVFGAFSDYDAEAKPKEPKPPFIPPIFKPMNRTLTLMQVQLDEIQNNLNVVSAKQDVLSTDLSVVDDGVNDIKSAQVVSTKILCGIATSPDCLP